MARAELTGEDLASILENARCGTVYPLDVEALVAEVRVLRGKLAAIHAKEVALGRPFEDRVYDPFSGLTVDRKTGEII
jgi:hypothetical protein